MSRILSDVRSEPRNFKNSTTLRDHLIIVHDAHELWEARHGISESGTEITKCGSDSSFPNSVAAHVRFRWNSSLSGMQRSSRIWPILQGPGAGVSWPLSPELGLPIFLTAHNALVPQRSSAAMVIFGSCRRVSQRKAHSERDTSNSVYCSECCFPCWPD